MSKKQELEEVEVPENALNSDDVFDSVLEDVDVQHEIVESYVIPNTEKLPMGGRLDRMYRSLVLGGRVYVDARVEHKIRNGLEVRFKNRKEYKDTVVYEKE